MSTTASRSTLILTGDRTFRTNPRTRLTLVGSAEKVHDQPTGDPATSAIARILGPFPRCEPQGSSDVVVGSPSRGGLEPIASFFDGWLVTDHAIEDVFEHRDSLFNSGNVVLVPGDLIAVPGLPDPRQRTS